ncbi:hypothetical protein J2Y66_003752 [Paenarthrobacter nitroguajacolicus]|nr:hypothetical protein [Paenarthrobacter nitroguajacolicus]MDR6989237.1 hypothetical protein [Paenarthrobacter nitroguajacolicus]
MREVPDDSLSDPDKEPREEDIPADAFSPVVDPDLVPDDAPADKGERKEP